MSKQIDINGLKEFKKKCDETYAKIGQGGTGGGTNIEINKIPQDMQYEITKFANNISVNGENYIIYPNYSLLEFSGFDNTQFSNISVKIFYPDYVTSVFVNFLIEMGITGANRDNFSESLKNLILQDPSMLLKIIEQIISLLTSLFLTPYIGFSIEYYNKEGTTLNHEELVSFKDDKIGGALYIGSVKFDNNEIPTLQSTFSVEHKVSWLGD